MSDPVLTFNRSEEEAAQIAQSAESAVSTYVPAGTVLIVASDAEYRGAASKLVEIKGRIKDLENQRTAIKKPILEAGRKIDQLFNDAKARLQWAHDQIERPMKAFIREQDEKRREEERRRKAEEDRLRQEAQEREAAERRRLEEIRQQQEAAAKKAETATNPFEAIAAKREAEALQVQEAEAVEGVTGAIRERATVSVPETYVSKPTAAGTSIRHNWKFRIVDASKIRRELMMPDEKKIGEIARTMKENASEPGIEFYEDISIGGR